MQKYQNNSVFSNNVLSIWLACFDIAIQNHRPNFDREMEFNVTATDMTKMNERNKTQFLTLFMYYAASEMLGLCKVTGYIILILSCWNNWHAIRYINPLSRHRIVSIYFPRYLKISVVLHNTTFKAEITVFELPFNPLLEQESPPAWTQEAYRPPCSEYSFCCPTRVPPPGGVPDPGTPPGGGTWPGYPPGGVPDPGTPRGGTWPGYPPGGGYLTRVPPQGGYLTRVPPRGGPGNPPGGGTWPGYPPTSWHSGKCCKALWDMGTPPLWTDRLMDGQTRVKTLPSLVLRTRAVIICDGYVGWKTKQIT